MAALDKQALRKKYLNIRQNLLSVEVQENSKIINQKLHAFLKAKKLVKIASYLSINNEVMIDNQVLANFIKYNVGNIKQNNQLWFKFPTEKNDLGTSWNNINSKIEAVIVPIVVFNPDGSRIGYGQGNYDHWLQNFQGMKIGVAYEFQKTNIKFANNYDVTLDFIITETNIY